MHADVIETEPGTCPICGMTLMPMEPSGAAVEEPAPKSADTGEREILYWYAPMDPTFISDEPGISPMGMKMVPKYADEGASEDNVIRIDPVQVQNMGVISEPVHRTDLGRVIRTVGIMDFDADNVFWVNVKFSGWIEKVYVNYVGQEIRKGQTLFEIYSPELVTTQEEYLRALDYRDSLSHSLRPATLKQAEDLLASARRRLSYWDITPEQVSRLESDRKAQRTLRVTSPVDGVVVEVMDTALEGMFVREGMNLYKLADMSSIWVHVDVYESDLSRVGVGAPAAITTEAYPGRRFAGRVGYVGAIVDTTSRTVKVRVEIPNPDRALKPGMFARADIVLRADRQRMGIPQEAIQTLEGRPVVFAPDGAGRFRIVRLVTGRTQAGGWVEVIDGLALGDRVVARGSFTLKADLHKETFGAEGH
jgi:Cu(I)/Ag(I) efflux system membrane fusion protein/cobalt-zinc-cadmium efflux system membrane fusion protein